MASRLQQALLLMNESHKGQTRWDGSPYAIHPLAVAEGFTGDLRIVALLHDVIEDSNVTWADIRKQFGGRVADAVDSVSRRKGEGETYEAFIDRVAMNVMGRLVKIADLRNNLSNLPKEHGLRKRYIKALCTLKAKGT